MYITPDIYEWRASVPKWRIYYVDNEGYLCNTDSWGETVEAAVEHAKDCNFLPADARLFLECRKESDVQE